MIGTGSTLIEGNLRDPAATARATAGCEVVLHQAAIPSVARSVAVRSRSNSANVDGTIQLMLAPPAGVRRVVPPARRPSTARARSSLPRDTATRPRSPYAASKLATEHYVHTLGELHGIETVVLRYFNVFGPGQDPASQYAAVVPVRQGRDRGGRHRRSTATVAVPRLHLHRQRRERQPPRRGRARRPGLTANIGCGGRYDLLQLLDEVRAAFGSMLPPVFTPTRAGDVRDSEADVTVARERLGYEVLVPFSEGVRRTVTWYVAQAAAEAPSG